MRIPFALPTAIACCQESVISFPVTNTSERSRHESWTIDVHTLKQLISAYREAAGESTDGVASMIASEGSNGVGSGLRNELWRRVQGSPGWLSDDILKTIFADQIAGFTWVSRPASGASAASTASTPPTAAGWVAVWSRAWNTYLHRNSQGVALTVSPAGAEDREGSAPQLTQLQQPRPTRSRSTDDSPRGAPLRGRPRAGDV
eukprot:COSAG02_NODE_6824_length_3341_cov_32.448489_3_plen_203_part_00